MPDSERAAVGSEPSHWPGAFLQLLTIENTVPKARMVRVSPPQPTMGHGDSRELLQHHCLEMTSGSLCSRQKGDGW